MRGWGGRWERKNKGEKGGEKKRKKSGRKREGQEGKEEYWE